VYAVVTAWGLTDVVSADGTSAISGRRAVVTSNARVTIATTAIDVGLLTVRDVVFAVRVGGVLTAHVLGVAIEAGRTVLRAADVIKENAKTVKASPVTVALRAAGAQLKAGRGGDLFDRSGG
jgi:hypothetical protein